MAKWAQKVFKDIQKKAVDNAYPFDYTCNCFRAHNT